MTKLNCTNKRQSRSFIKIKTLMMNLPMRNSVYGGKDNKFYSSMRILAVYRVQSVNRLAGGAKTASRSKCYYLVALLPPSTLRCWGCAAHMSVQRLGESFVAATSSWPRGYVSALRLINVCFIHDLFLIISHEFTGSVNSLIS